MKFATAGLAAHIDGETTSMATCWKLKRTDGVIIAATSLDIDIPFDLGDGDGEIIYKAATGFNRSALQNSADFSIGNMDIQGIIESLTVTKESVRSEIWDFASVHIFQVNWKDLADGEMKMQRGYLGRITLHDDTYVAEFRDLMDLYNAEIGNIVTADCIVDLFSTKCGVRESPPDWVAGTEYGESNTNDAKLGDYVSPGITQRLELEDGLGILLLEDFDPTDGLLLNQAGNDRIFRVTVAGSSDETGRVELEDGSGILVLEDFGPSDALTLEGSSTGTGPDWNLNIDGLTVEGGGLTWITMQANKVDAVVDQVTDRSEFTVLTSPLTDAPDEHFIEGTVLFTTGPNNALTLRREIKSWDLSTRTIVLWRPMPFDITSGETLNMSAGCRKSVTDCAGRFLNIRNHRGWPHVPGNNKMILAPGSPY